MHLTKQEKSTLRAAIFHHLDGIATGPTALALHRRGVLAHLAEHGEARLDELTAAFRANEGYLNVALRVLASQGWLTQGIHDNGGHITFAVTEAGREAFGHVPAYQPAVDFLPDAAHIHDAIVQGFDPGAFLRLKALFKGYGERFGLPDADNSAVQQQVLRHIEGLIAGPIVVALGINGLFHEYFSVAPFEVEEFTQHHKEVKAIVDFFTALGWFERRGTTYSFTPRGLFFARRATSYGVTVSYVPTFQLVPELLFGNANALWVPGPNGQESHVDRTMNVWGSGGAHISYFKKIDEVIVEIFNRPIDEQPKGFLDMGCGNGAFMAHIFEVIWRQTERGKMLEDYPLFIVGADYNEAALVATRKTLNQAGIWAKVVQGDIGKPEQLAAELQEKYNIFLGDLLNVRSFLDHNRIYEPPAEMPDHRASRSTGAYAYRGRRIPNAEVEQNLVEHLRKWMPYVRRFGLLVIELHTIAPALAAANRGKTAVTAYDATHGYSDQYILELECFLAAAAEAGLYPDPACRERYPDSELATVSINLLREREDR